MDYMTCLERLRVYSQKPTEHEEQIKNLTSKLLTKMKSAEKSSSKEKPTKLTICNNLDIFTAILQSTQNVQIIGNIALILQDLLETKATKKKSLTSLQGSGSSNVMFQLLPLISRDAYCPENILPAIFSTLLKLATKDPQFAIKVRNSGGLSNILSIIKSNTRNSMLLKYLMQVLKICMRNSTNCAILGKEGLVPTLLTIITYTGRRTTLILKLALELTALLAKHKNNVSRIVKHGGVPKLLQILENWNKYDGENKLKICKADLTVIGLLADYPIGMRALSENGGIAILYNFCTTLPQSTSHDNLLILGSIVLQKCLPRQMLPVNSPYGPYNFPVPSGKKIPAVITLRAKSATQSNLSNATKNATTESDNENDDIDDDEEEQGKKSPDPNLILSDDGMNSINTASSDSVPIERSDLTSDELYPYKRFFSELYETKDDEKASLAFEETVDSTDKKWRGVHPHRWVNKEEVYKEMSISTNHVSSFVKLAYPELCSAGIYQELEPLYDKDPAICRIKLLESLNRSLNSDTTQTQSVFDLDDCVNKIDINPYEPLGNDDESRVGKRDTSVTHLKFESRFESGNLRKALQIGPHEYELVLTPDVNTCTHIQWFYFEISNMDAVFPYTFHIVNCEKQNSQFNFGMKPVMYSVKEAMLGRPGWVRFGTDICYYKNVYYRERPPSDETQEKCYFTASFTLTFPHAYDVCYLAYHYPYTYSLLQTDVYIWGNTYDRSEIYFKSQELCRSLGGNSVPVVTITSSNRIGRDKKHYIFLTSRVHPGETNSSWVMKGCIDFLLSDKAAAQSLREMYIFKLVPMLNPDGVINGCHRCDLTAEDMNRCWLQPSATLQSPIYHTKALLLYLASICKSPLVYCDFHGHSRKKNIFLYGCCNGQSWSEIDRLKNDDSNHELLPRILHHMAPAFSMESCVYNVEKIRESTARVTVWRQIKVQASYTLESSYCGCDQGMYEGMHLGIKLEEEMGQRFCHALVYVNPHRRLSPASTITKLLHDEIRLLSRTRSSSYDHVDVSDDDVDDKFDSDSTFKPIVAAK